jgi:hypothetical protein
VNAYKSMTSGEYETTVIADVEVVKSLTNNLYGTIG